MKKKFLKLASTTLALLLLLPLFSMAAFAVGSISDSLIGEFDEPINFSMEVSERYFPFIYNEDDSWLVGFLGENDCVDGYLYLLDQEKDEIRLLTSESVKITRETPNAVYCVMADNRIVLLDYFGKVNKTIYASKVDPITRCERMNSKLYFVEGNKIVCLDLISYESEVVFSNNNIKNVLPREDGGLIWFDGEDNAHLLDMSSKSSVTLTEDEFNSMISRTISVSLLEQENSILAERALSLQEDFPFSDYPSNTSYFTKNGSACTDHAVLHNPPYHISSSCNCKKYGAAYQCMGFAYYASDRYAHILGTESQRPSIASGDLMADITFTDNTQMYNYFKRFRKGAYIRFSKTSTSGDGNHSVVLVSCSSTSLVVYDCNWDNQCGVQLRTMTYSEIRNKYPYICKAFSHSYTGTAQQVSDRQHKRSCGSSGCMAYIYEGHMYDADSGSICTACGYSPN